jgi:hypothetical protein
MVQKELGVRRGKEGIYKKNEMKEIYCLRTVKNN